MVKISIITQTMKNKVPTYRQLETELSQQIRNFYLKQINFKPQQVTCKLFSKYLAIVADNAVTPVESNLWISGNQVLIKQVRNEVNAILRPQLSKLISEVLNVEVVGFLSKSAFETNRCIILVVLSQPAQVRNYQATFFPEVRSLDVSPQKRVRD